MLASLVNYLIFNDYPLLRGDVALVVAGVLLFCAALALVYAVMPRLLRAAMEALLIAFIIDINSKQVLIAIAVGLGLLFFLYAARKSILRVAAIIGAFVIVTSLLGLSARKPWIETVKGASAPVATAVRDKPAIIHIIMDEHIGIEGIPQDTPQGVKLKEDLRSFYETRGFALFGRAYSQHMHTINAIPFILNYGKRLGGEGNKDGGGQAGPTSHLENLRTGGYRLHIMQSDYVDFCTGAQAVTCTTYNSSSLHPTLALPMSTSDRAGLILNKFIALTSWAKRYAWSFQIERRSLTSSVAAELAYGEFIDQVREAQPGDVFFAHLLLPHYPYALDSNCRFLPRAKWLNRQGQGNLRQRKLAYFAQVKCATSQLDKVLDALAKSPARANSVVIVHGDHGSRLTTTDPKAHNEGAYTKDDLIAGFSTLFAVRGPRTVPGYRTYLATADSLLRDTTSAGFEAPMRPVSDGQPTVIVDDLDWKPTVRVPFPRNW